MALVVAVVAEPHNERNTVMRSFTGKLILAVVILVIILMVINRPEKAATSVHGIGGFLIHAGDSVATFVGNVFG